MNHSQLVVYEHSAAISNIHVDSQELITDDYDGIVILRNLRTYRSFAKIFRRGPPVIPPLAGPEGEKELGR